LCYNALMFTIACYQQKGGVGKSTSVVSLAFALANRGKSVLVVDADPQTQATSWLLGDGSLASQPGARDIIAAVADPATTAEAIRPLDRAGLSILAGSPALGVIAESLFARDPSGIPRHPTSVIAAALATVQDQYDFALVDCAPGVTLPGTAAVVAANLVLAPTLLSTLSFDGLRGVSVSLVQMQKNGLFATIPALGVLIIGDRPPRTLTRDERQVRQQIEGGSTTGAYRLLGSIPFRARMNGLFARRATPFSPTQSLADTSLLPVRAAYEALATHLETPA